MSFCIYPWTSLPNLPPWLAAVHHLRHFKSAFSSNMMITLGRQDLPCTCLPDHVLGSITLTDVVECSVVVVDAMREHLEGRLSSSHQARRPRLLRWPQLWQRWLRQPGAGGGLGPAWGLLPLTAVPITNSHSISHHLLQLNLQP